MSGNSQDDGTSEVQVPVSSSNTNIDPLNDNKQNQHTETNTEELTTTGMEIENPKRDERNNDRTKSDDTVIEIDANGADCKGQSSKDNQKEKNGSYKTQSVGFNKYNFLTFCLLLAPLIMGFHISALFNGDTIQEHFSVKMGYSNETDPKETQRKNFPTYMMSLGCLYPIGGMVGALTANMIVNSIGRKKSTFIYVGSVMAGSIFKLISYYTHFALMIIGRFFDGVGSSGIMVTAIVLMFELMNDSHARIAKPLVQILINLGIICICVLLINETMDQIFQFSYLIPLVLGVLLIIILFILPESPVFIYSKYKDPIQTLKILEKIHGDNAPSYLQAIEMKAQNQINDNSVLKTSELFKNGKFRLATISCILINAAQQLSGINAVMAFAPTLLEKMKFSRPDLMSLIIIGSGLVGSIVFAPVVTNFRRKLTLLVGFGVMAVCMTVIVIIYNTNDKLSGLIIALFVFFVFTFQIGPGPLVWFISMEVFPSNAIPSAQSVGVAANWISNAIVYSIPYKYLGNNIIILFVVVNVAIVIYGYFFMAETYKRGSEEILADYEQRSKVFPCC